jgi:hypothetical protein
VVLGDLEVGSRRWIVADDISGIRYRCARPDGSQVDQVTGFTPDEVFGRVYIRITAEGSGTNYDLAKAVKFEVMRYKLQRWLSQLFK